MNKLLLAVALCLTVLGAIAPAHACDGTKSTDSSSQGSDGK